ncbi:MAG: ABC transporter permease [Ruminococcus sp.]|nr:ABC transporter permease [Ruminococcus sp.]
MKRKLQSTTSKAVLPIGAILVLLLLWQGVCAMGLVPGFMLPSPIQVFQAFISDFGLLMQHAYVTLLETLIGMIIGIAVGFLLAVLMDRFEPLRKALYPLIVLTQTIPTVAIAPLLVLWFGYEMLPKIILIVLVVFFPIAVNLLDGYRSLDQDTLNLLRSMGAGNKQLFLYVKFPAALGHFFSSLKIAVSYAVVSSVIAEWLGGFSGLGVYMTRVKKAYSFDKMFAVIFLISLLSLLLIFLVNVLQKKCMPWENKK